MVVAVGVGLDVFVIVGVSVQVGGSSVGVLRRSGGTSVRVGAAVGVAVDAGLVGEGRETAGVEICFEAHAAARSRAAREMNSTVQRGMIQSSFRGIRRRTKRARIIQMTPRSYKIGVICVIRGLYRYGWQAA